MSTILTACGASNAAPRVGRIARVGGREWLQYCHEIEAGTAVDASGTERARTDLRAGVPFLASAVLLANVLFAWCLMSEGRQIGDMPLDDATYARVEARRLSASGIPLTTSIATPGGGGGSDDGDGEVSTRA